MSIIRSISHVPQSLPNWNGRLEPFSEMVVPDYVAHAFVNVAGTAQMVGDLDPFDSKGRLQITFHAPICEADGYGSTAIDLLEPLDALTRLRVNALYGINPQTISKNVRKIAERRDVFFPTVGFLLGLPGSLQYVPERTRVCMTMWETTDYRSRFPEWTRFLNSADGLITPSEFCADLFESSGVTVPINTVELSAARWSYLKEQIVPPADGKFRVVTWANIGPRKNPEGMIKAFVQAFPADRYPHCEFVLKSTVRSKQYLHKLISGVKDTRIRWIFEDWTPEQMIEFARTAHVMLYLAFGEGSGRPPREALAMGLPLICSNNTGMQMIASSKYVLSVPCRMEPAPLGGNWFVANTNVAASHLRSVHDSYTDASRRARLGMQWFQATRRPENVARDIVEVLSWHSERGREERKIRHDQTIDVPLVKTITEELTRNGRIDCRVVTHPDLNSAEWAHAFAKEGLQIVPNGRVIIDIHRLEHSDHSGDVSITKRIVSQALCDGLDTFVVVVPSQFYTGKVIGNETIVPIRHWRGGLGDGTFETAARYAGGVEGRDYIVAIATKERK